MKDRFKNNVDYVISIDTIRGVHLGVTPHFRINDGSKFAVEEREKILKDAIENKIIEKVENIIFTMYEVKSTKLGNYLEEVI